MGSNVLEGLRTLMFLWSKKAQAQASLKLNFQGSNWPRLDPSLHEPKFMIQFNRLFDYEYFLK